jgi:two-component system, OmpR family, response regulator
MKDKAVYTTGEAAKVCNLSQQTIIRCFDSGRLKGFRVPGSKFRRIPYDSLLQFMKDNDIPLEGFGGGKIRVLVVDDDPETIQLFADALQADGRFEVTTAQTGYDAGILTEQFCPDIVVIDFMLPDINGNLVCKTIRQTPELSHIKIMVMSGMIGLPEFNRFKSDGADEFVKKPFNIQTVIGKIVQLVRG